MRILILPALLATGLCAQTPVSKPVEPPWKGDWAGSMYSEALPQQTTNPDGWFSSSKSTQSEPPAKPSYVPLPQFRFQPSQQPGSPAVATKKFYVNDGDARATGGMPTAKSGPCSI